MTGKKPRSRSGTSLDDLVAQNLEDHGPKLDAYLKFFAKPTLPMTQRVSC
jgi:hypothetical protein